MLAVASLRARQSLPFLQSPSCTLQRQRLSKLLLLVAPLFQALLRRLRCLLLGKSHNEKWKRWVEEERLPPLNNPLRVLNPNSPTPLAGPGQPGGWLPRRSCLPCLPRIARSCATKSMPAMAWYFESRSCGTISKNNHGTAPRKSKKPNWPLINKKSIPVSINLKKRIWKELSSSILRNADNNIGIFSSMSPESQL